MRKNLGEIGLSKELNLNDLKRPPRNHQVEVLTKSWNKPYYALLMDRGTGKTKVAIDTFSFLYKHDLIDAVLIIAPNEVHTRWITEHLPKDLHEDILPTALYWEGPKKRKEYVSRLRALIDPSKKELKIFSINIEAIITTKASALIKKYLEVNRVITIIDESTRIKTPKTKRTKAAIRIGKKSDYRRILTGNEITNTPFDVYSQFRFLKYNFWYQHNFFLFKHYFGEFEERFTWRNGRKNIFENVVGYKNLGEIKQRIEHCTYRIKKSQCLDLPPKIYETIKIELNAEQRKIYQELKDELCSTYDGQSIDIINMLSLTVRHRQITGGYFPESAAMIGKSNPKIDAILYDLEDIDQEAIIIWAVFVSEIKGLYAALSKKYDNVETYYGATTTKDRMRIINNFQAGKVKVLIANPETAGTGLNLQRSNLHYYFSNSFKPEPRWQSEDRSHRDGQHWPVLYKDIIANNTIDVTIINALKSKTELSAVLSKPLGELL